jgi:ABC-type uncharacterized transport system permease subunit
MQAGALDLRRAECRVENPDVDVGQRLAREPACRCLTTASSSSAFPIAVLGFMWWLLTRTRLGLFVRP